MSKQKKKICLELQLPLLSPPTSFFPAFISSFFVLPTFLYENLSKYECKLLVTSLFIQGITYSFSPFIHTHTHTHTHTHRGIHTCYSVS